MYPKSYKYPIDVNWIALKRQCFIVVTDQSWTTAFATTTDQLTNEQDHNSLSTQSVTIIKDDPQREETQRITHNVAENTQWYPEQFSR